MINRRRFSTGVGAALIGCGLSDGPRRARAERDGDEWVLHGQKTWCSRGAFADWMFGLFRTDPSQERHRGLSFVLVPLDAPGVTVRPIAQLDGETGFAEVFLDDVRVPVTQNTVGAEGEGWKIAMSTAGPDEPEVESGA